MLPPPPGIVIDAVPAVNVAVTPAPLKLNDVAFPNIVPSSCTDIAPPVALPVSTIMLNVLASPFVNVIVLRLTEAVTNELAVIAEVTYDEVAASKLPIL